MGDSGAGLQAWINRTVNGNFAFKSLPVIYPSSPSRSYSIHDGKEEKVWFDQLALSPNVPEDWVTISNVGSELSRLINQAELKHGIPAKNTIIGGFSMGGAMAIHLGFKFKPEIAGVFALSSFLPPDSLLYKDMGRQIRTIPEKIPESNPESGDINNKYVFPKLFMSHGSQDPIIPIRWAKSTFRDLRKRGVDGHFYTIENTQHAVNKQQLSLLHNWIEGIVNNKMEPPSETDKNQPR